MVRVDGNVDLWDLTQDARVRVLDVPGTAIRTYPEAPGDVIVLKTEDGHFAIYRRTSGERIAVQSDAGDPPVIAYSDACDWVTARTVDGVVLRFTNGWQIPFLGFRSRAGCAPGSGPSPVGRRTN